MKIKIFENENVRARLKKCLEEGYFPATVKQIYDLKQKGKIDKNKGCDTSTLYFKGMIRTATKKELKNIEKIYEQNGRLLYVNINEWNCNNGLGGDDGLGNVGRFVGVKK